MFADSTALAGMSAEQIHCIVKEIGRECERMMLTGNLKKSDSIKMERTKVPG